MFRHALFLGLISAALVLFAAGCASAQPTPPPLVPTTAPVVIAPTRAPTNSSAPELAPAVTSQDSSTITLVIVPDKSKAGYRVREQLAGVSLPSDAVGTTSAVSGQIVGKTDGTIDASKSKFVVDLRTLKSDQSVRDGFIQRTPLQTSQYPNATFVPTSATGLPSYPPSGPASFSLTGNLTIKDVTKPVTWDVTCQPASATEGTCHATTTFTFEDFNLQQPQVARVLSIVDKITLELDLDLQRAGA